MAFTKAAFSSTSNMGSETSETRLRCSTGERMPRGHALLQHLKALGVVAHAVDVRADEGEVGLPGGRVGRDLLGERHHDAVHVLEPVPARDLHDQRGSRVERTALADDLGLAGHGPGRPGYP